MKTVLLKCRDNAAFKPARSELEGLSGHFHSDTLWSALVNIWALAYPESVKEFIAASEAGEVRFSSVFPCLETTKDQFIYLLPRPRSMLDYQEVKAWKKIQWVSAETLKQGGEGLEIAEQVLGNSVLLRPEELPVGLSERARRGAQFFARRDLPKVKVHSPESTGSFYYQSQLHLRAQQIGNAIWQPHFYFLYEISEEVPDRFSLQMRAVIRMLAEEGLGGERKNGLGNFRGAAFRDEKWWPEKGNAQLSLSVVAPQDAGEWDQFLAYTSIVRGGGRLFEDDPAERQRRRVRMLGEGSVFQGEVEGKIHDISPLNNPMDFPILRYGKCFSIPFDLPAP